MSKGKAATVAAPAETAASAPPQPAGDALVLKQIKRGFAQANARLEVIREATLTVKQGEIVALMGPSGSGKSTLLHIAGLLERPESGEIWIRGQDASKLNDARRTELRRTAIGFVYQYHHLLPEFSALENVMLPQMLVGVARGTARTRAR